MEMFKMSVIMPVYLGDYLGSTGKNKEKGFLRAIKSFTNQTYDNKELIIISDGCEISENIYKEYYKDEINIHFIKIPKQPMFSGVVRNIGLEYCTGDYICYLDSDDFFDDDHIENVVRGFEEGIDFVYYDDYLVNSPNLEHIVKRRVNLNYSSIGTSSISHRPNNIRWTLGYGHDFIFVSDMISSGLKFKKIEKCKYFVC